MSKQLKLALITAAMIIFSWQATPFYFNHLKDASGSAYANLHKMATERGSDRELLELIKVALGDQVLSSTEYSDILRVHYKNHGTFTAHPVKLGRDLQDGYDRDTYRNKLLTESLLNFND